MLNSLPAHFLSDLVSAGGFGLLGIVVLVFGFMLFDWSLRKVDFQKELNEKNWPVAFTIVGFMACVATIVSTVISKILS